MSKNHASRPAPSAPPEDLPALAPHDAVRRWDAVVVGGGTAGLSAALMLGRARRRVLVIDEGLPRNRFAAHMHGVLGHDGTNPLDLLVAGRGEVARYGVRVVRGSVSRVERQADEVRLTTADDVEIVARAIVVATGMRDGLPDLPGLAERWGSGVLHCPYCRGWEVRGRRLGVLATSALALHQVQLVRQWSDQVTLLDAGLGPLDDATRDRLRSRGIEIVTDRPVEVLGDDGTVTGVRTEGGTVVPLDAIFVASAPHPHEELLAPLHLERDETPFGSVLAVDASGRTSDERVWAVGNVSAPMANVPMAASAGAMAGAALNMALVTEDFDQAEAATAHEHGSDGRAGADPVAFWEQRYAGSAPIWSGRPNASLVTAVEELSPGRALDRGCGEGGDAIRLASRGWDVTAVDLSPTAVERATEAAARAGVPSERLRWVVADLATWRDDATYDLVSACFLQSPVTLDRTAVLRRAAARLAPGGRLVVVSHAAPPPWSEPVAHNGHLFLAPEQEVEALGLAPSRWQVETARVVARRATAPDGTAATLDDSVVVLRRR